MKQINILKTLPILFLFLTFSCGSDNDDPTLKSITIEVSENKNEVELEEKLTFIVKDENQKELTDKVVIFVDNNKIEGTSYTFKKVKDYIVYAKYKNIESSKITIKVIPPSTHTTKVLLEDYTETWCGYCPAIAIAIEKLTKNNKNIIPVALHNEGDFKLSSVKNLIDVFDIMGVPTLKLNRGETVEKEEQITKYLDKKVNLGLAISSSLSDKTLKAKIKVHFDYRDDANTKLVVYLLENGLIAPQANYYNNDVNSPLYQKGNPIENFEHNHVARLLLTSPFGDKIPEDKNTTNGIYEKDFSVTLPATIKDTSKLSIVAFVVNSSKQVINVQEAKVGEDKDFD